MPKLQRVREVLTSPPTPDYWMRKAEAGWRLIAVEWAREVQGEPRETEVFREEVPFGMQVASDCLHLEENPAEQAVLMLVLELIADDRPLSQVATELNQSGHRTRLGTSWTPEAVFNLLPRLIDAAPHISSTREWISRRASSRPIRPTAAVR